MNQRLNALLSLIPDGCGVIDVGTDHGCLPAALAGREYPGALFASDIRPGPLAAAERTARDAGLENRIRFLLADGLDGCEPEAVDTIVIAGMGGDTICGILDRAEWCMDRRYTLVLQPMTRAEVLRYWLVNNEFAITHEDLVLDGGIVYSLFTARFGGVTRLNEAELYTGSCAMLRDHPLFPALLKREQRRFARMLKGIDGASSPGELAGRRAVYAAILEQLKEMEP